VGDVWHLVEDETQVAGLVKAGDTIFMATGRQTLHRYENLKECTLICRQIDESNTPFPFPNGRFLIGRPPFSVADEEALFTKLAIDWLVVKNAGGDAPRSKLEAARGLGIPVVMINRPQQPDAHQADTVAAAIAWAKSQ
jgi:precorrin-6A/cobalt-precorrin-6A reductase